MSDPIKIRLSKRDKHDNIYFTYTKIVIITTIAMCTALFITWNLRMTVDQKYAEKAEALLKENDYKGAGRVCAEWSGKPNWKPCARYHAIITKVMIGLRKEKLADMNALKTVDKVFEEADKE